MTSEVEARSVTGAALDASWFDRLGPRARRRATPRLGPVLGGAGAALASLGLLVLAVDSSEFSDINGDGNKMIGVLLCAAGTAAGYALIFRFREGGLATFGSAGAALLLPFGFVFLAYDEQRAPPFSVDVVLTLSIACWLGAYLVGPSKGRPVFLGAAAIGLWLFLLEQVEGVFGSPWELFALGPRSDDFLGTGEAPPDAGTIGLVCLVFAAAYLALGFVLHLRGLRGMATPLLVVGFLALFFGFFAVQDDLAPGGAGMLLAASGALIVLVATQRGLRGSAWIGGSSLAIGLAFIVGDAFDDSDQIMGPAISLVIVGSALALAGDRWAHAMHEPSELAPADVLESQLEAQRAPRPETTPPPTPSTPPVE